MVKGYPYKFIADEKPASTFRQFLVWMGDFFWFLMPIKAVPEQVRV
jgi:hypothetical protein